MTARTILSRLARTCLLLLSAASGWPAAAQVPAFSSEPGIHRDAASAVAHFYGVDIRADAGSECRVGTDTSNRETATIRSCSWDAPTSFSVEWSAQEVRLTVGATSIRRPGSWALGKAIRISAAGSGRVVVTRVEDEWTSTVVAGDGASAVPAESWITGTRLGDGWKISGTIERRAPSPSDAITINVGEDPRAADPKVRPLTSAGGIAGPYAADAPALLSPGSTGRAGLPSLRAAVTRTWTGAASGLWSAAANWSPAGALAGGDQLEFGTAANTRQMTSDVAGVSLGTVNVRGGGYSLNGPLAASSLVVAMSSAETFSYAGNGGAVSSTRIDSGRLLLDGVLNSVTIAGGTLATANGATVGELVGSAGRLTPTGFGSGAIFVRAGVDLGNRTEVAVLLCNGFQQIRVTGRVALPGAQFSVSFCPGYEPNVGDTFVVIDNDGTDPVNGRAQGTHSLAGSVDVTFDVDYKGGDGNDVVFRVTSKAPLAAPDLVIAKAHTPEPFRPGGQGGYTLRITNNGTAATSGLVTVTDTLPSAFTPSTISGDGWNCTLAPLACTRSDALAIGSSYPPIQLTVLVGADVPSGSFDNRAGVSGGGDTTPATATDTTRVVRGVDLKITKVHPEHFVRGEQGTVTLEVRNIGSVPASAPISVTDLLADGLAARSYSSTDWTCTIDPGGKRVNCIRNTPLPPSGTGDLHSDIQLTLEVSATAPDPSFDTATVTTSPVDEDVNPSNNTTTLGTPVVDVHAESGTPDVTIFKRHQGSFFAGGTGSFSITLQNVGDGPTAGRIQVRDVLPAGLTPRSATGSGWSCDITGQVVLCDYLLRLQAHSQETAALIVQVDVSPTATGDTNHADVKADGDPDDRNDAALDKYIVIGAPQLALSKTHTGDFVQGQTGATYALAVTNNGQGPTTGRVTVRDSLPSGLTPRSATGPGWACLIESRLVTCTRDTPIALQETSIVTLTVDVADNATSLVNIATLSGGGDATSRQAADPTTVVGRPQLTISKSHADPVLQGQQGVQFTLIVLNNGSRRTSQSVTVTDQLPPGLVPVDATGEGWRCGIAGQTVTCSRSDAIEAGQSYAPIHVSVNVAPDAQSATNAATVSGGDDTTPADNTAADLVAISTAGTPNLVLIKQHEGTVAQGQSGVVYRLRVDNRGSAPTSGAVTVVDDLPSQLSPTAAAGEGWTCTVAEQRVACTRADVLAAAASWPIVQITVDVSRTATSFSNSASVTGGGDSTPGDSTASDPTTVVVSAPDLRLTKRHDDPFVNGQRDAVYRITVTNAGTAPTLGEVIVSDDVPAGLTPTRASGDGWQCAVAVPLVTCRRSDALAAARSYPEVVLFVDVAVAASSVANVATVRGGGDPKETSTASDFTNLNAPPDAAIQLVLESPLLVGHDAAYVAVVTNVGSGTIGEGTQVVVDIPAGLIPVDADGSGWACETRAGRFVCTQTRTCAPGDRFPDLRLRVHVSAIAAQLTTSSTVDAPGDADSSNNSAEVTTSSAAPAVALRITKVASTDRVLVGGAVLYRIQVSNAGDARIAATVVRDILPRGFRYAQSGSDLLSSTRSPRQLRASSDQDQLDWVLGTLSPGEVVTLTYRVIVGADARSGPQDNRATASGLGPTGAIVSADEAVSTVDVVSDVFSTLQALVGRVFEDLDGNGQFTPADRPIANARLITSTGQAAITDPDGLYNIPSLGAGSVVVSLDRSTVSPHLTFAGAAPGERSWTRLLRTPAGGGTVLVQNFALIAAAAGIAEAPPLVSLAEPVPAPAEPVAVAPGGIAPAAREGLAVPPVAATARLASIEQLLDSRAGALPPRRDYESRDGERLLITLGEVSFGRAAPEFEVFKKDSDAWGYASVFLQTPVVSSRNRFTFAYDSHRRLNGTSVNDRLFELDPNDRVYPLFGDTSRRQEFATSNAKFFGRLERGSSYVMYGDLVGDLPSSGTDGGRWSSYQRHLTGGEVRLANNRGDGVTVRGAQPSTSYARDVFSGSLLGILALSHQAVRPGTETVAVEIRDRRLPERVVSREVLARAIDYELNPLAGTVFLRRHLAGLDSALNLVQVVATYEYESAGLENTVYSGRGTWAFGGLRVGGAVFTEQGAGDGRFTVAGLDLDRRLPRNGRVQLEVPYSHGMPSVGTAVDTRPTSLLTEPEGFGVRAAVEQPVAFWSGRITGSVTGADRGFQNPFSSTITPGALVADGQVELLPRQPSRLRLGMTGEDYGTASVDAQRTTISAAWTETIARRVALTAGYDQRWLKQEGISTDSGLVTAAARVAIGSRVEAGVSREQNVLDHTDPTYPDQTLLGARYRLGPQTSLFYTQRISDDAIVPIGDFRGTGFYSLATTGELSAGVESRVANATTITSRYQVDRGINGPDAFALIGVLTQVSLGHGFAGTFGGDWGKSVAGSGDDYKSGTLGVSYVGSNRFKATGRYEARDREGFSSLFSAGLAGRLTGGLTGLVRTEWLKSRITPVEGDSASLLAALAIRPATTDRAGLLFSYQYVDRDQSGLVVAVARDTLGWRQRLSTDGYLNPVHRLELHGRVAWLQADGVDPFVNSYLVQGRAQVTIHRFVDGAVETRYVRQQSTSSSRTGTSAEAGFWPAPDFRVAVGYSFDNTRDPLGRDLEGRARGYYLTLSTKLSRLFDLMGSKPIAAAPPPTAPASTVLSGDGPAPGKR